MCNCEISTETQFLNNLRDAAKKAGKEYFIPTNKILTFCAYPKMVIVQFDRFWNMGVSFRDMETQETIEYNRYYYPKDHDKFLPKIIDFIFNEKEEK